MASSATSMDSHRTVAAKRNGMLLRLKSWIASISERGVMPREAIPLPVSQLLHQNNERPAALGATILVFPSSGYARLAHLASDLRSRFASLGLTDFAPFILEFDPVVRSRLWIDLVAFIEFCGPENRYRMLAGDAFQGRAMVETSDFGLIASLAGHYILACLIGVDCSGDAA